MRKAFAVFAGALLLTGCAATAPVEKVAIRPTPTASAAPEVPAPALVQGGGAEANQPFFDAVSASLVNNDPEAGSLMFVDALTDAGFDRASMERTNDRTSINLEAGTIQFSVQTGGECIIGQYGPESGGYRSITALPLHTGKCLIGNTVPIR